MLFGVIHGKFLNDFDHMISNPLFGFIFSVKNFQVNSFLKRLEKVKFCNSSPNLCIQQFNIFSWMENEFIKLFWKSVVISIEKRNDFG